MIEDETLVRGEEGEERRERRGGRGGRVTPAFQFKLLNTSSQTISKIIQLSNSPILFITRVS